MEPRRLRGFAARPSNTSFGTTKLDVDLDIIAKKAASNKAAAHEDPKLTYKSDNDAWEHLYQRTSAAFPGRKPILSRIRQGFRRTFITQEALKGNDEVDLAVVQDAQGRTVLRPDRNPETRPVSRTEYFSSAIDRIRLAKNIPNNVKQQADAILKDITQGIKDKDAFDIFKRKVFADEEVEAFERNARHMMNREVWQAAKNEREALARNPKATVQEIRKADAAVDEAEQAFLSGPKYENREEGRNYENALHEQHKIDNVIAKTPGLKAAYDLHLGVVRGLQRELIRRGLIHPDAREFYFPHYIIDKMGEAGVTSNLPRGRGLSRSKTGQMSERVGGREFSRDYIAAMKKYISETMEMLQKHDLVTEIGNYYHAGNNPMANIVRNGDMQLFQDAINRGEAPPVPRGYVRYQLNSGFTNQRFSSVSERVFGEMLDNMIPEVAEMYGISPTYFDVAASAMLHPDRIASSKGSLARMRSGQEVVIPAELADAMTIMVKGDPERTPLGKLLSSGTSWFKTFAIHARPFSYNVRNAVGDIQRMVAQFGSAPALDPEIWTSSLKEVADAYISKKFSDDFLDAQRLGAMSSGRTAVEAAQTRAMPEFERLHKEVGIGKLGAVKLGRLLGKIPKFASAREDVVRLAVFKMNLKRHAQGKEMLYGATDPDYMRGLLERDGDRRAAAAIARKSLIDFGDFTQSEDMIRGGLVPFYSWIKGNTMFWGKQLPGAGARALKNLAGGQLTSTDARVLEGIAYTTAMVMGVRLLWNNLNEDMTKASEKLPNHIQESAYMIIPDINEYNKTGKIKPLVRKDDNGVERTVVLNIPDALDDFMDATGLAGWGPDLKGLTSGRLPPKEFLARRMEDAKDPINYVLRSFGPVVQIFPATAGIRMFPDPLSAKQVAPENRWQNFVGSLALTGLPGAERVLETMPGNVSKPFPDIFDWKRQAGYREVAPQLLPSVENDLVYQINKSSAELNDLGGRIAALAGRLSQPQITPEERAHQLERMKIIYRSKGEELKKLGERYHALKRARRVEEAK